MVRELKTIPILQVAQGLGLKVKGRSARCFGHWPDRNPSLRFNLEKNTFRCYVCPGVGGSVIDLVMQVLNVSFRDALAYLGGGARKWPERRVASGGPTLGPEERSEILSSLLAGSRLEKEGLGYLSGRGIGAAVAQRMGIGFLRPEAYRHAFRRLARRFGPLNVKASGLTRFYLFAKEGLAFVLFPYRCGKRVHAIQGRCLLTREEAAARGVSRFVMTGRAGILYNHDVLDSPGALYLCEGEIDTLTLLQAGYPAIGIPGSGSFDPGWLDHFRAKRVVICLDPDPAGREAAARLAEEFTKRGIQHLRVDLPGGMDVNDAYLAKEKNCSTMNSSKRSE